MAMIQTEARATSIQNKIKLMIDAKDEKYITIMMDPVTIIKIITILLPYLIECFEPSSGEEAANYVKKRHSPGLSNYGGYDKRLVKAVTRQALRAGRRHGVVITWEQANILAIATLEDIRTGDKPQMNAVIIENAPK